MFTKRYAQRLACLDSEIILLPFDLVTDLVGISRAAAGSFVTLEFIHTLSPQLIHFFIYIWINLMI